MKTKDELNQLSGVTVDSAMEVHREFGPGLLERVYEASLARELSLGGISPIRQVPAPVVYKGELLDGDACRIDFLVAALLPIHEARIQTYMRLSKKCLGWLINFHVPLLKDGIKRHVVDFPK